MKKNRASILKNTLTELVSDLKFLDGDKSRDLEKIVKKLSPPEALSSIKSTDSELYNAIPVDLLKDTPEGIKYLKILSFFQPRFDTTKPPKETKKETTVEQVKEPTGTVTVTKTGTSSDADTSTKRDPIIDITSNQHLPESFRNLLTPNDSNRDIINLASDLFQDMNLQETLGNESQPFDMSNISNMMGLFNNIGQVVQSKVDSGELDMEQLERQATTLCGQLQQTSEVTQIMQSNPDMLNLLNSMGPNGPFTQGNDSNGSNGGNGSEESNPLEGLNMNDVFKNLQENLD